MTNPEASPCDCGRYELHGNRFIDERAGDRTEVHRHPSGDGSPNCYVQEGDAIRWLPSWWKLPEPPAEQRKRLPRAGREPWNGSWAYLVSDAPTKPQRGGQVPPA